MSVTPIILCGGKGSRLKPFLQSSSLPKQFLNILDKDKNLLQQTVNRLQRHPIFGKPIVVGNLEHREHIEDSLDATTMDALLLEPIGRNTGPAIAAAVSFLQTAGHNDDDIIILMPVDHYIKNTDIFIKRLETVVKMVANDITTIVTLFAERKSCEKNYGHIKKGPRIEGLDRFFTVDEFIEKPDYEIDNMVWNCGIYIMSIYAFKSLLNKNAPDVLHHSHQAVLKGAISTRKNRCRVILDASTLGMNRSISFDEILMNPYIPSSLVCAAIGTHWEDVGIYSGIQRLNDNIANAINKKVVRVEGAS